MKRGYGGLFTVLTYESSKISCIWRGFPEKNVFGPYKSFCWLLQQFEQSKVPTIKLETLVEGRFKEIREHKFCPKDAFSRLKTKSLMTLLRKLYVQAHPPCKIQRRKFGY